MSKYESGGQGVLDCSQHRVTCLGIITWQKYDRNNCSRVLVVVYEQPRQRPTDLLKWPSEKRHMADIERNRKIHATYCLEARIVLYCDQKVAQRCLFAGQSVWYVWLTPAHRSRCLLWCPEHKKWTNQQSVHVLFTDKTNFCLISDFGRIQIWRERETRNHPTISSKGSYLEVAEFSSMEPFWPSHLSRKFNHWCPLLYWGSRSSLSTS